MIGLIDLNRLQRLTLLLRVCIALLIAHGAFQPLTAAADTPSKVITFEDGSLVHPVTGVTRVSGNVVLDDTSAIKGVYAAGIQTTDSAYLEEAFPGADDVFVTFYLKINALPSDDVRIAQISNDGTTVGAIGLRPNGQLRLRYNSNTIGSETAPLLEGAIYRVGIRQKRGAGADAILEGYLATGDDPFVAPFAGTTVGKWTTPADRVRLGATNSNALDALLDDITLDLGAAPQATEPSPTAAPTDAPISPTATPPSPTPTPEPPTATPTATATVPLPASATPTAIAAGNPDPSKCTGYPEPRVFVEAQAWWITTPGKTGTNHGHVHVGTCFPYAQKLSGKVDFDIRVILHDNPGKLNLVRVQLAGDFGQISAVHVPTSRTCAVPGTCEFWYHVTVDTTKSPYDGRQEFRFGARLAEPDGATMLASTGWQAYLNNGKPVNDYRSYDLTEARGWYTNVGYINARLDSTLPTKPVSGI
ncbi:MAG: hypothetical protein HW418_2358, partial [Anaerolineales bacterium]|nr:hypothetical protein [Anaerolineales bacterium]